MYGSDAIGGVILLKPCKFPENPGMDGDIDLVGGSNNKMGAGSMMLEGLWRPIIWLVWKIQGTFKKGGKFRSARVIILIILDFRKRLFCCIILC